MQIVQVPRDEVPRDDAILAALAAGPLSSAALAAATGMGQRRVQRALLRLQDLGHVVSPVHGIYGATSQPGIGASTPPRRSARRPTVTLPPAASVTGGQGVLRGSYVVPGPYHPAEARPAPATRRSSSTTSEGAAWRHAVRSLAAAFPGTGSAGGPTAGPGPVVAPSVMPVPVVHDEGADRSGTPTWRDATRSVALTFPRSGSAGAGSRSSPAEIQLAPANDPEAIALPDDDDRHGEQGIDPLDALAVVGVAGVVGTVLFPAIPGRAWRWIRNLLGLGPVRPTPGPTQAEPPAVSPSQAAPSAMSIAGTASDPFGPGSSDPLGPGTRW